MRYVKLIKIKKLRKEGDREIILQLIIGQGDIFFNCFFLYEINILVTFPFLYGSIKPSSLYTFCNFFFVSLKVANPYLPIFVLLFIFCLNHCKHVQVLSFVIIFLFTMSLVDQSKNRDFFVLKINHQSQLARPVIIHQKQ